MNTDPDACAHHSGNRRAPAGVGLGLRWDFAEELLATFPKEVPFWEVSPENYMDRGGYYAAVLDQVQALYPVITHGLTLAIGSVDPPDAQYLAALSKELRSRQVHWHSDHLSGGRLGNRLLHELLPVRQSWAAVRRIRERSRQLSDQLEVPFALENITYYAASGRPEMTEAEFISEILDGTDCRLLLDVNNVFVNAQNHRTDPWEFLQNIPLERVIEIHVAGHSRLPTGMLLDTHGSPVIDPVLDLLSSVVERVGPVPVLLERDHNLPPLQELLAERQSIQTVVDTALARRAAQRNPNHARAQ